MQCLQGLVQAQPSAHEIIVVTDGDTEGSEQVAQRFGARTLSTPSQSGPAKARNLGAQQATGEILFFVDADVVIHQDALTRIGEVLTHQPDVAAVFGSYDEEPGEPNFLSQYKNLLHRLVHQISNEEASTFWSGCGAIRREVFLGLGGFDERYRRPSIEDIELGYRLKKKGFRIKLCKQLQCKHLKRWGVISLLQSDFFDRALPWTRLILRDRQPMNDLNLQAASRWSVILVYGLLFTLIFGSKWPLFLVLSGACSVALFLLNKVVYRFFYHIRGFKFTIQAIFWHWLYYLYCGLALLIGVCDHVLDHFRVKKCL